MDDRTNPGDDRARTAEILKLAFPPPPSEFVSRDEFNSKIETVESKIANSELKNRNWVLVGCLALILTFGGGYMSLVSKLDRLNEAMPVVNNVLDGRRSWMMRKEQRDGDQDRALKQLAPDYIPQPYVEPPR